MSNTIEGTRIRQKIREIIEMDNVMVVGTNNNDEKVDSAITIDSDASNEDVTAILIKLIDMHVYTRHYLQGACRADIKMHILTMIEASFQKNSVPHLGTLVA